MLAFPLLGASAMSLSVRLRNVDLTLDCKYCGHPITKSGQWFLVIAKFKCRKCKREVGLAYTDKLALFEKHAHLAQTKTRGGESKIHWYGRPTKTKMP